METSKKCPNNNINNNKFDKSLFDLSSTDGGRKKKQSILRERPRISHLEHFLSFSFDDESYEQVSSMEYFPPLISGVSAMWRTRSEEAVLITLRTRKQ